MATTTARTRAQVKADYDAFLAACPSRQLLDRISDKWVALILAALGNGGPHPPGSTARPIRGRCATPSCPADSPGSARRC